MKHSPVKTLPPPCEELEGRGVLRNRGGRSDLPRLCSADYRFQTVFAALLLAGLLTACSTGTGQKMDEPTSATAPAAVVAPAVVVTADDLEGNWGLASYRNETDRPRTETEAKSACSNPYPIVKGRSGGVLMHLADQTRPQEVYLKTAADGQLYLGPKGRPALPQDRLIVSFGGGVLVTQWVDPGAAERFGTMVFVRCAA